MTETSHWSSPDDLRRRLDATRWLDDWPVESWQAGTDALTLRRLVDHWAGEYDWETERQQIELLPWSSAHIDGGTRAFLHFAAEGRPAGSQPSGGLPIILTNGWPSTALELVDLARRLSSPSQYGGDAENGVDVVVPAIPGLPFSPQRRRLGEPTEELWHRLMSEHLGFSRYVAHGGDLGAGITTRLGAAHPEAVAGIHLLAVAAPLNVDERSLTVEEHEHLVRVAAWTADESAYQHQQQTRPLTLAADIAAFCASL